MSEYDICSILKTNPPLLLELLSKFNEEKGRQISLKSNGNDTIETNKINSDEIVSKESSFKKNEFSHSIFDILPGNDNSVFQAEVSILSSASEIVDNNSTSVASNIEFNFVKNGLYYFLTSSLEGSMVLGIYKMPKVVDYERLKNLVIFNELREDPLNYK